MLFHCVSSDVRQNVPMDVSVLKNFPVVISGGWRQVWSTAVNAA